MSAETVILGMRLEELAADHAQWSQATFGNDETRGPIGALRHLQKEAKEAEEACDAIQQLVDAGQGGSDHPPARKAAIHLAEELADCLLLLLDASRRTGLTPLELIEYAQAKMCVNRNRSWPTPADGIPCEHVQVRLPA